MSEIEYTVARATSPDGLAAQVNVLIAQGWIPTGGLAATPVYMEQDSHVSYELFQAVTRKKSG